MSDQTLVAAIAGTRKGFDTSVAYGIDLSNLSESGRAIATCAAQQYERDSEQTELDLDVLDSQLARMYGQSSSMAESISSYARTLPDVSPSNILDEYRLVRRAKLSLEIAALMARGAHGEELDEKLKAYSLLSDASTAGDEKLRLSAEDFRQAEGRRMPLMPASLNKFVGGGLLPGHNVTVYGRPDSGKSLFAINQAAFCLANGHRVLYVANEEPATEITKRLLSRLCNIDIAELADDIETIAECIEEAGEFYDNFNLLHKATCTANDIRRVAARVKPNLIIVDQLKNLSTAGTGENRALQLDKLARDVRELGIHCHAATLSVTQAGGSADGKAVLSMTDVEWSTTGIPGAADLMIGIGVNDEMLPANKRTLSVCKNKINGRHGSLPVWVRPERTEFRSSPIGDKS